MKTVRIILAAVILLGLACTAYAGGGRLVIVTTKPVQDSGLFSALIPAYEKWTKLDKVDVRVVAAGSVKALENGRRGDADLLLLNDPDGEEKLVKDGFGDGRVEVMYNDFIIVGPKADPAGVSDAKAAPDAMKRIFDGDAPFVSRGDGSSTHTRETKLWNSAGRDPAAMGRYMSAGKGMADTVRLADENRAYTLVDRATYNRLRWKLRGIRGMFQGGPELVNQYSAIAISPGKRPGVNHEAALDFIEFLTGRTGQKIIGDLRDERGGVIFVPNAKR